MSDFESLMGEVRGEGGGFGHREHVHLAWLAVRRYGVAEAVDLVGAGIREVAAGAGRPGKYNVTMSRAWVELVGHHVQDEPEVADFDAFVERNPALMDKGLLDRFYSRGVLFGPAARAGWITPDRAPFPWSAVA